MIKIYEEILSRLANNDLESIHSYISDKLLSNYSADRIYNMIVIKFLYIAKNNPPCNLIF